MGLQIQFKMVQQDLQISNWRYFYHIRSDNKYQVSFLKSNWALNE
jgi:hypothetical protein